MTEYHAHVFFELDTAQEARMVSGSLTSVTGARQTRWLDRAAGPLPQPSFQVEFNSEQLGSVAEWLMLHRRGLSVLIHPETGDDLLDHTAHAA